MRLMGYVFGLPLVAGVVVLSMGLVCLALASIGESFLMNRVAKQPLLEETFSMPSTTVILAVGGLYAVSLAGIAWFNGSAPVLEVVLDGPRRRFRQG